MVAMSPSFMEKLVNLRREFGRAMVLSSAFRCPDYDRGIGGAGVHPTGHAVDVRLHGADAFRLLSLAPKHGFTGIGVNQNGPRSGRFLHLDDTSGPYRPRVWSY